MDGAVGEGSGPIAGMSWEGVLAVDRLKSGRAGEGWELSAVGS
jgi:hypothetical protein